MSDPLRWRDPSSGADDELRALLRGGERTVAMTAADQARTAARLAGATTAAAAAGKTAATGGTVLLLLKSAAVGAALGALVLAGAIALGPRPAARQGAEGNTPQGGHAISPAPERAGQGAPPGSVVAPPAAAMAPTLPESPRPPTAPVPRTTGSTRAAALPLARAAEAPAETGLPGGAPTESTPQGELPAADPLARETRLVQQANDALGGNPAAALAQVQRIAAEYPAGELAPEREFIRVRALRALGRGAEARAAAEALLARYPRSTVAPRARRVLEELE